MLAIWTLSRIGAESRKRKAESKKLKAKSRKDKAGKLPNEPVTGLKTKKRILKELSAFLFH
jgi:hypothetical protein